jgi:hypothetical protein
MSSSEEKRLSWKKNLRKITENSKNVSSGGSDSGIMIEINYLYNIWILD